MCYYHAIILARCTVLVNAPYCVILGAMKKETRDRSNEAQVYISKKHHAGLKLIADAEGRTMRKVLENYIDNYLLTASHLIK